MVNCQSVCNALPSLKRCISVQVIFDDIHCQTVSRPTRQLFISARLLVDPQTSLGHADLDGHVTGGSTRSGGTPARLMLITGDRHKGDAIDMEKGRYGHNGYAMMMTMMLL